jgi:predicted DNA-binding protein
MSSPASSRKRRFPISVTNEFWQKLDHHAKAIKKTKSEVLEEYSGIVLDLSPRDMDRLQQLSQKSFRSISEQLKHVIHDYLTNQD